MRLVASILIVFSSVGYAQASSDDIPSKLLAGLQWRLIGPFRAGRVTAVAGSSSQPNTYYFGTPGGGVWKTNDGGHVWRPIFDQQPVAGIGSIGVAPSDPRVIYVGTGENAVGDGMYKSTDSGATWTNVGLRDTITIQSMVIDPKNPDIVVAGVNSLGYRIIWRPVPAPGFTANRGIFKTIDGGKTWKKVLTRDDTVGVVDLCADTSDPRKLYASLYHPASGFGDSAVAATSDIVVSTDQGSTWHPLASKGLPEKGRGRLGIAAISGRLYAIVDQGFYRSDDGGANWQQSTKDPRVVGSEYFSRVFADPSNADILYVAQTSLYRSTDGGHTFEAYVGAPSGDDFHVLWIDPRDGQRMLLGVDQGAIVSVNGGQTWGSWYNQPTGEFYHVSTDNAFPYHVYGAQQDSGTASVASRSDYGIITDREFQSISGFEYCFIAPDPLNPNFIYSGGWFGTVVRFDKSNGQVATIFERGDRYRSLNLAPLHFAPTDHHTLYFGTQFVMRTTDGGTNWKEISPDLTGYTEADPNAPRDPDKPRPPAISALGLSPLDAKLIWAGTSNQVVQVTRDGGKSWQKVSPAMPLLTERQSILVIEPSHFDAGTAYVVAGSPREQTPPYIVRTHDFGRTWQPIFITLPANEMAGVIREDPARKGVLYVGTDKRVYVSFDEGEHWQSLQLNMPVVVISDLEVRGDDLVVSTYGRGLWILDDIAPLRELREINAKLATADVHLFPPASAMRVRWDNFQDTPYPIETPAGQNPPDGAIIDYVLGSAPAGEIAMTIYDDHGRPIRRFSSATKPPSLPPANVPEYWFGPVEALPTTSGAHRFVWDLRYPAPVALPYGYYGSLLDYTEYTLADHAIPGKTPRELPSGPLVMPGKYTVELSAAGKTLRQPLTVKLDPRLHVPAADLQAQLDLELRIDRGMAVSAESFRQVEALRKAIGEIKDKDLQEELKAFTKKLDAIDKGNRTDPGFGPVNRDLGRLASNAQSADTRPAETTRLAVEDKCKSLDVDLTKWREVQASDLTSLNAKFVAQKLTPLPATHVAAAGCGAARPGIRTWPARAPDAAGTW